MQYAHNRYLLLHHPGAFEEAEYRLGTRNLGLEIRPWQPNEIYNQFAHFSGGVEPNYMLGEEEARLNSPETPRP